MDIYAIFGIHVCNNVPDLFYDLLFKSIKFVNKQNFIKHLTKKEFSDIYFNLQLKKINYDDTWWIEVTQMNLIKYYGSTIFNKKYTIDDFINKLIPSKNIEKIVTIDDEFYLYYFSNKFIIAPNKIDHESYSDLLDNKKSKKFETLYYVLLEKKIIYENFIVATIDDNKN
jgi:hypothetical protein